MPRTSSSRHQSRGRAQAVTTARQSQDDDRGRRMKHYLLAMGIRTACFPLTVWAFATERYVVAWVAALAAILIPSFAVMLANAVDRRQAPVTDEVRSPRQGLGPGPAASAAPQPQAGSGPAETPRPDSADTPIQGTIVSSRDTAYPGAGPVRGTEEDP